MIILTIRTDKPEAELGLYDGQNQLAYDTWQAHRQLAETIHHRIVKILQSQGKKLEDIEGIVAYEGPGSFTGLRIGLSVVNALSYSIQIPVTACGGDDWVNDGIESLLRGNGGKIALPNYGGNAHITPPRK